jgi:HD-GYP domain-containing protein (c-di-GMP phosphodiesterase class II)
VETASHNNALALNPYGLESAAVEPLLEHGRPALVSRMPRRELLAELGVGAAVLAAGLAIALLVTAPRSFSPAVAALFVAVYALASRIEFDVGSGYGTPIQLVFVPMLLALPSTLAPFLVIAGWTLGRAPEWLAGRRHLDGLLAAPSNAAYTLGPALVVALAGAPVKVSEWPIFVGALGAQLACDAGATLAREWIRLGVPPHLSMRLLFEVFLTDVSLTPVAAGIALLAATQPLAVLLPLPLGGLLRYFSRDRRTRIEHALELSRAYRGTAMLLGDIVEADDAYTGSHSRDVVELAMAVGPELGLDADRMRMLEFAALLHDVGKINIPKSIINKPGSLTQEERAIINMHTIEGEKMLENVGGVMADVGRIVRSCHERADGLGYPDGLWGEEIPVEARIIACCDAFNAMTTDRPYRKALSLDEAIDELRAQRGKQFDAAVVDVLLSLYA